jgi:RNA polymerase sigma factor (sigma-70 family)
MASARLAAVVRQIRGQAADYRGEQSDDALLHAFLGHRDEAAFEALLRRHGPMVLRVCRRALGNAHDAEDALQATFLVLAQKAASIRKRESLVSWLHGVAYRMATHAKRAAARRHHYESRANTAQPPDPALRASWQELQALLDEEIAGLPETLRAPFILCCLESKSYAEAARQLDLQEGTVRNRLARARKQLQERLTRRGLALTTVLVAVAVGASGSAALPRSLVGAIVKAATQLSAGQTLATGMVSAGVLTLVAGVTQTMFLNKCKTAILLLVCTALAGIGLGMTLRGAGVQPRQGARQASPGAARREAKKRQPAEAAPAKKSVQVRGRVFGPDGKPFAGARLYLSAPSSSKTPTYPVRATSGADGRFAFSFVQSRPEKADADTPLPQVTVLAIAKGHGCDWVAVGAASKELTVRLVKDVPVRGRILDPDGRPVAGARLRVIGLSAAKGDDLAGYVQAVRHGDDFAFARDWSGPLAGRPAVLTTGADGRFTLTGAGRKRVVHLYLEGPDIASVELDVMTCAAKKVVGPRRQLFGASFDYVAVASRTIRGVVRDKDTGKPLAGMSVRVWTNPRCQALTDKLGRYELRGVAKAASYWLAVSPADGLYFQRQAGVADTLGLGTISSDIDMVRGLTVRGKVADKEGKPVARARVEYYPLYPNPHVNGKLPGRWVPRAVAHTSPDGSYVLTVLPGPGVIGVIGPRPEAYMHAWVTLLERKNFFKGTIVNPPHESILHQDGGDNLRGAISQDRFNALVLLNPGEKEPALIKDVTLEPGRTVKGRVVGPDGRPVTGVTVFGLVNRLGKETLIGAEFTVRHNPRLTSRPLVFFHKERNLGFFLKGLRSAETPLTVRLEPCGSVSGRVVDQDGQPVAGLRVRVVGLGLNSLAQSQVVVTDRKGRFRAEGLVPGQPYLLMRGRLFAGLGSGVSVESGKNKDMGDVKARLNK